MKKGKRSKTRDAEQGRKGSREDVEGGPRRLLGAGATLLMIALGIVGTTESDLGAWLGLGALVVLIYGLHRFGRLGPTSAGQAAR